MSTGQKVDECASCQGAISEDGSCACGGSCVENTTVESTSQCGASCGKDGDTDCSVCDGNEISAKMGKFENSENGEWEPRIIAFLCNWCSYAGADLAGTSRLQYPPNIRVIRVPCSGRINPIYIVKALMDGADGVMVSGCHPGDCHYLAGNLYARRRFIVLKKLLTSVGLSPDRVQFTWVSASEGGRFAEVIKEVTENVRALGKNEVLVFDKNKEGGLK